MFIIFYFSPPFFSFSSCNSLPGNDNFISSNSDSLSTIPNDFKAYKSLSYYI